MIRKNSYILSLKKSKILQHLEQPFKKDLNFLLILFVLISLVDVCFSFVINKTHLAVYLTFHGFLTSYVLTLLGNVFHAKWMKRIYQVFILIIANVFFVIDAVCIINFHYYFSPDMAAVIAGTNLNETLEFLQTYISLKLIFILVCLCGGVIGVYYIIKRKKLILVGRELIWGGIGLILGIGLTLQNPRIWERMIIGKIVLCVKASDVPDLELVNPQLQVTKERTPDNVVLIIGESFSKSHSSLYSYSKETNPYLSMLRDSSSLFVYNKVTSPGLHTIESIQCIMSSYKPEYKDSVPWFKCLTLPELFGTIEYNTFWISNQSKKGMFDNIVGKYADLCQENYFVGNKFSGMNKQEIDESVLGLLSPIINRNVNHNFYVIHLMGSHYYFDRRYPPQFGKFTEDNYLSTPSHQRYNLATYDNSILYNDSVVYEIMNLFADKETLAFYLSDHALDVYESSENYVGHARESDSLSVKAGSEIPFMIYASPKYQEHFPHEIERIKNSANNSFRADDLLYTIMDIVGVQFDDKQEIKGCSLLNE